MHDKSLCLLLYDHLPCFVKVKIPCTSFMMAGHVNTCQIIGISVHLRSFKDTCYAWCQISSKFVIPRGVFWQLLQRWKKRSWKARPGGQAEIKNVTWCILHFQFQLCHKWSLFRCKHTLYIYGRFVKKKPLRFLRDGLVKKYWAKCKKTAVFGLHV